MASKALAKRVSKVRKALFDEGFLSEQFEELEALQAPDDSTFLEDIFIMFLTDMRGLFSQLEEELEKETPNAQVLDKILHRIKGTAASVGAKQLSIICNEMREYTLKGEVQNCKDAFVLMQNQLELLNQRMDAYFELCTGVVTAGANNPSSASAAKDEVKGKGKGK